MRFCSKPLSREEYNLLMGYCLVKGLELRGCPNLQVAKNLSTILSDLLSKWV